jgi:tetratricopeptide (TPR) repeat protein
MPSNPLLTAAMIALVGPGSHPVTVHRTAQVEAPCPTSESNADALVAFATAGGDSLQAAIDAGRPLDDREDRACWYRIAERIARMEAAAAPGDDVNAQYRLALALGLRADVEGGRTRIGLADELYTQLQTVLALDPDHPEAKHIFGRLHAGVMRMNRVTRFLATRLLGGDALRGASWEEAETLLQAAEQARPEVPDYHFELGRLYEDTDRPELAAAEARHVLAIETRDEGEQAVAERAEEMLARVEPQGRESP